MKPADFFVGVMDFFSVLLPGSLVVYLCRGWAESQIADHSIPRLGSAAEGWVAFLFASYLVGQFIFIISASFMDSLYDRTYRDYHRKKSQDRLYARAKELVGKDAELAGVMKWCGPFVRQRCPAAADELDRLEATSKFFRSIAVVFGAVAIVYEGVAILTPRRTSIAAMASTGLALMAFWRFCDLRWKLTERAYLYFVQMNTVATATVSAPQKAGAASA